MQTCISTFSCFCILKLVCLCKLQPHLHNTKIAQLASITHYFFNCSEEGCLLHILKNVVYGSAKKCRAGAYMYPRTMGFFSHKLYYSGVREKWDNVFVKLRVKYHPFCGIAHKIPYTYGFF